MTCTQLIELVANAIATKEGFFVTAAQWRAQGKLLPEGWRIGDPITLPQRNNNPGNLRSWGRRPIVQGYAHFEQPSEGWSALRRQVALLILRGCSFRTFFAGQRKPDGSLIDPKRSYPGYCPKGDGNNDPNEYAAFVVTYLKQRPPLRDLPSEQRHQITPDTPLFQLEDPPTP